MELITVNLTADQIALMDQDTRADLFAQATDVLAKAFGLELEWNPDHDWDIDMEDD